MTRDVFPTPPRVDEVESFIGAGRSVGLLFTASWCAAGVLLGKDEGALRGSVHPLVIVDTDAFPHLADRYQVRSLPTLVLLEGSKERGRLLGAFSASDVYNLLSRQFGGRS